VNTLHKEGDDEDDEGDDDDLSGVISHSSIYSCHDFSQFDRNRNFISNAGKSVRLVVPPPPYSFYRVPAQ
jgi:hypothetical protein